MPYTKTLQVTVHVNMRCTGRLCCPTDPEIVPYGANLVKQYTIKEPVSPAAAQEHVQSVMQVHKTCTFTTPQFTTILHLYGLGLPLMNWHLKTPTTLASTAKSCLHTPGFCHYHTPPYRNHACGLLNFKSKWARPK